MTSKSFFKVPMRVLKKYSVPSDNPHIKSNPSIKSWGEFRKYSKNCMKVRVGDLIWSYKDQDWSEVIELYISWYYAHKLYDEQDYFSEVRLISRFVYPNVSARVKCSEYEDGLIVYEIIRKDQG